MKKLFTLLVALTTIVCGLNAASLLLQESFNRTEGDLSKGLIDNRSSDQKDWWYITGTSEIQIVDSNLLFSNYHANDSSNAIRFAGSKRRTVRAFNSVSKGSVYYGALINVKKITGATNPLALHGSSPASGNAAIYAELRIKPVDGGYKLGISKANEDGFRWSKETLPLDSTILVVARYDLIEGDTNDVATLWINPTKLSEPYPSCQNMQDSTNTSGNKKGANQKKDPTSLSYFNLRPASQIGNMIVDEIKVATKWADLFEGGGSESDISVKSSVNFGGIYQGESAKETLSITGQNLKAGVSISKTSSEISLSTTSFTKAEAEAGANLTISLNAQTAGSFADTIVITSDTIVKKVVVSWTTYPVTACADIAAIKTAGATPETLIRLTGEVIVTRDTTLKEREIYIQDASGAAKIKGTSVLDAANMVGQKIKNFVLMSGEEAFGILPFEPQTKPTVVSSSNEVEPQVVTLATLQANAVDYLLELIQVQKVTFADEGSTFKGDSLYKITQGEQTANVKTEMTRGFAGVTIPGKANVTGFSMNTSGSAILPRSAEDIVNASEVLLKNGSFEEFKSSQSPFGSATTFDDWDLSGILGTALAVETTDVLEGKAAFKTTKDVTAGSLYQEINCENYATGDQFDIRICYKNLDTKDSAIVLNSYWASSMGATEPLVQPEELKQALPNSQVWDTITIRATKPEQAKYFVMKFKFAKKAQVLLDNLDFKYYEDTVPYFSVMPEKETYSFTANINSDTTLVTLTIRQRNLKQPVKLELLGTGKAAYSIDKTQVTAAEETVTIKFKTSTTGKFNATLNITDDESTETSLMNKSIWFYGTAIDPTKTPEIKVTPMEFDTFRCKAYEKVTDTIFITSSNCSDAVHLWANEQTGEPGAFGISDSYFSANSTDTVILTFAPKKAGNYTVRLKAFTTGVDTIFINVAGVAEEGQPEPIIVDWDTTFVWKQDKPYKELNEQFNHADTCYNKTLKTTDWQNVVLKGQRPWWGFKSDTTKQANMTSYYYQTASGSVTMETWLVTPALDYKNATKQVFSFRVMGEFMQEEQTARLEVYYIDATNSKDIWFQHLEAIDSLIPAKDSELNGQWTDVYLSLTDQEFIPDVFFMAFKFTDNGGDNGIVYYVDDVTWGIKDVPSGIINVNADENVTLMSDVHKFVYNGKLYILKNGKRYNLLGQIQ